MVQFDVHISQVQGLKPPTRTKPGGFVVVRELLFQYKKCVFFGGGHAKISPVEVLANCHEINPIWYGHPGRGPIETILPTVSGFFHF